ncbi:MAG TPA: hypothetical protein VFS42_07970 [Burkholderiaceae bacterium]|nr:hypothetical protein [Burkholderiaceae bacterium]
MPSTSVAASSSFLSSIPNTSYGVILESGSPLAKTVNKPSVSNHERQHVKDASSFMAELAIYGRFPAESSNARRLIGMVVPGMRPAPRINMSTIREAVLELSKGTSLTVVAERLNVQHRHDLKFLDEASQDLNFRKAQRGIKEGGSYHEVILEYNITNAADRKALFNQDHQLREERALGDLKHRDVSIGDVVLVHGIESGARFARLYQYDLSHRMANAYAYLCKGLNEDGVADYFDVHSVLDRWTLARFPKIQNAMQTHGLGFAEAIHDIVFAGKSAAVAKQKAYGPLNATFKKLKRSLTNGVTCASDREMSLLDELAWLTQSNASDEQVKAHLENIEAKARTDHRPDNAPVLRRESIEPIWTVLDYS